MKIINYKNVAMAAIAVLGMAALAAHADEGPVPSRTVRFSDLKPHQAEGAKMLYRACVEQAVLASIREINIPRLTEPDNAHAGTAQTTLSVAAIH